MDTKKFYDEHIEGKFGLITGVPCSFFKGFINEAINRGSYLPAVDEGAAVAIATGYQITSGKKALVLMQNSGIGNAISPLTSLNYVFREPITLMVSTRGGANDEPQHELMGCIDRALLGTCECKVMHVEDFDNSFEQVHNTIAYMVPKGTFEAVGLEHTLRPYGPSGFELPEIAKFASEFRTESGMSRIEAISYIRALAKIRTVNTKRKHIIIATTGMTGRELWSISDDENNLYMVGSMGCALALSLGMALGNPDVDVYCLDGDGAALMRTGTMATVGNVMPTNLTHVLLDNGTYDTTGGQPTESTQVNWAMLAKAFGYDVIDINQFSKPVEEAITNHLAGECRFILINIKPGHEKVGRPTLKPYQVKERLINYINHD